MSTFPFAMVVSQSALAHQFDGRWNGETFEFASALPNAPVVDDGLGRGHHRTDAHQRAYRARSALAATLRRAAEAVAPAPSPRCRTAR